MIKVYKIIKASDILNAELLLLKSLDSRTRDHSLKLVEHERGKHLTIKDAIKFKCQSHSNSILVRFEMTLNET